MKKMIFFILILSALNSYTAHILNNRNTSSDKEMMSLISGKYNTETELAVVSKAKGSNQESATKAENDGQLALQGGIKEYSYNLLNAYLKGIEVEGTGFDSKKMKDLADNIAKEALASIQYKGKWITGKNETVVLYTIEKETIKKMTTKAFKERLNSLIHKLTEYRNIFETLKIQETK